MAAEKENVRERTIRFLDLVIFNDPKIIVETKQGYQYEFPAHIIELSMSLRDLEPDSTDKKFGQNSKHEVSLVSTQKKETDIPIISYQDRTTLSYVSKAEGFDAIEKYLLNKRYQVKKVKLMMLCNLGNKGKQVLQEIGNDFQVYFTNASGTIVLAATKLLFEIAMIIGGEIKVG